MMRMLSRLRSSRRSLGYAAVAVAVGLNYSYLQHHEAASTSNDDPISFACTSIDYSSMDDFVERTGYQSYDRHFGLVIGDPRICILTQQLYEWRRNSDVLPMLLYALKLLLEVPVIVMTVLEAGRPVIGHPQGILFYPTVCCLLYYVFGTASMFPLIWITSYCLFGGKQDAVSSSLSNIDIWRGPAALATAVPSALLFLAIVTLDPDSVLWKTCVGILGSPLLALLPYACRDIMAPRIISGEEAIQSAKVVAATYCVMGTAQALSWMTILYFYSTAQSTVNEVMLEHSSIGLEIAALWLAWMTHLAFRSEWCALEAVLLSLLVGPAAAISMELATLELEKFSVPKITHTIPRIKKKSQQQQSSSSAGSNNRGTNTTTTTILKKKKKQ